MNPLYFLQQVKRVRGGGNGAGATLDLLPRDLAGARQDRTSASAAGFFPNATQTYMFTAPDDYDTETFLTRVRIYATDDGPVDWEGNSDGPTVVFLEVNGSITTGQLTLTGVPAASPAAVDGVVDIDVQEIWRSLYLSTVGATAAVNPTRGPLILQPGDIVSLTVTALPNPAPTGLCGAQALYGSTYVLADRFAELR